MFVTADELLISDVMIQPPITPPSYYPAEWDDDDAMSSLFSACDVADSADFAAKSAFWLNFIDRWTRAANVVSFTAEDVMQATSRRGDVPQCLPTILERALHSGELTADDAEQPNALSTIIRAFTRLFVSAPTLSPLHRRRYAQTVRLSARVVELCDATASAPRGVFDVESAADRLHWTAADCAFVIAQCVRIGRARIIDVGSGIVAYKLISVTSEPESADVTVARLQRAHRQMKREIAAAQAHADTITAEVRSELLAQSSAPAAMKSKALRKLRSRALIQRRIDSLYARVQQVDDILFAVAQSSASADMIRLLNEANKALRAVAVDVEHASDLIAETSELVSDVTDVDNTLSRDIVSGDGADLDVEFAALCEEINRKNSEQEHQTRTEKQSQQTSPLSSTSSPQTPAASKTIIQTSS